MMRRQPLEEWAGQEEQLFRPQRAARGGKGLWWMRLDQSGQEEQLFHPHRAARVGQGRWTRALARVVPEA
jgi:hypothetical protein